VGTRDIGHTRRRVLGAGAGVTLSMSALVGCGLFDDEPEPPPAPDPLQPVLDEALALAASCERLAVAEPDLAERVTALAADHRAHATELARVIGAEIPSAAPSASAPVEGGSPASLRKAVQAALKTATTAARQAPAERAALVGSIAACRAAHAEALK
jgi:hypothetical protein